MRSNTKKKITAADHDSYGTLSLLALLIAPAGFVLGIVYLTKSDLVDRKLGEHLIAVSVVGFILAGVAYAFLMPSYFLSPYYM